MANSLKDFYQDVEGELISDEPSFSANKRAEKTEGGKPSGNSQPSGNSAGANGAALAREPQLSGGVQEGAGEQSGPNDPARQTIDAGRSYEEIEANHKVLTTLLDRAKAGSPEALRQVVKNFGSDTETLKITITQPLRDAQGREPDRYGIKLIHNEEEWAAITRDWETASAYFPEIELHNYPTTRRGKRLAVVMGVTAKEFNAVIIAERRKARLENDMQLCKMNIDKGRKEMGVDNVPPLPSGKDQKPAPETPGQKIVQAITSPTRSIR